MSSGSNMYTPAASRAPSARATPQPTGPPASTQAVQSAPQNVNSTNNATTTTTGSTNTTSTGGKSDNPRPQKLRLSCDACAGAKVKCNKEHPSCGRCINMGQNCVYSPSRKFGKPSAKKRAQQAAEKQLKSRPLDMHADARPGTRDSMFAPGSYGSTPFPTFDDYPRHPSMAGAASWGGGPYDRHQNQPLGGYGMPHDLVADISHQFPTLNDREPAHFSPPLQMNSHGGMPPPGFGREVFDDFMSPVSAGPPLSMERSHDSSVASTPFLPSPLAIPTEKSLNSASTSTSYNSPGDLSKQTSLDSDRHDCYNIASATMASLHYRAERRDSGISTSELISPLATPRMGLTDSAACAPSLDQVLRNNKAALVTVSKLLTCPCARNPHNAMLYSSIISKILTWYRVAGGAKSSGTATPVVDLAAVDFRLGNHFRLGNGNTISPSVLSNPTSGTATPTSTFNGSSVAHVPITIGGFSLDEEDQDHLRRQLLMSELRKAERVIDSMATKCMDEEGPRARQITNQGIGLDDGEDHLHFNRTGMGYDDDGASDDEISLEDVVGLYRTLAAWLKSELTKTLSVLRGGTSKRGSISHANRPSISSRLAGFAN